MKLYRLHPSLVFLSSGEILHTKRAAAYRFTNHNSSLKKFRFVDVDLGLHRLTGLKQSIYLSTKKKEKRKKEIGLK
jgi:hypothetical protein